MVFDTAGRVVFDTARRGRAWMVVALLWLAYLINYTDRQVVFSIFPVLEKELGFTGRQLGLIGAVFLWVYSLCSPLAGRLADRFRLEWLIPASLALWSLATLGTGSSGSAGELLFWRGVMGVTEGMYFPAAVSAIATLHPGRTRSRAIAVHGSAQFAGGIVGGWFGGWMADAAAWRRGFSLLAAIGIGYTLLLRLGLGRLPAREAAPREATGVRALASRCYGTLAAAFFVLCAMLWMCYAWLPSLLHQRFGLTLAGSGFTANAWLQAASAAGIFAGGALADWLCRRIPAGRFYIVGAGLLLCSPFAWLAFAATSLAMFKLAAVGFGLFAGMMMSNVVASAYDVVPASSYGIAAGALTMIGGVAGGLSTLFAGEWRDSLGLAPMMACASVAGIVAAVALVMVVRARFDGERCARDTMESTP